VPEKPRKFELKNDPVQERLPLPPVPTVAAAPAAKADRRRSDTARLVWASKPKRPPSPRDVEFQTAEIVQQPPAP
jgi:hypothetical protein